MGWTAAYDAEQAIVRAVVDGPIDHDTDEAMMRSIGDLAREHRASRLLVDARNATLAMSVAEIRDRPRHYATLGIAASARLAIVFSEWTPDAVLLEATIEGRAGLRRVFIDVSTAVHWLLTERR